jgi:MscS family membrane protein
MEQLTDIFLRPGPLKLLWWQWAALLVLVPLAGAVGWIASRFLRWLLRKVTSRTAYEWDDYVLEKIGPPLTAAMTLAAIGFLLPWIDVADRVAAGIYRGLKIGYLVIFFWTLWRGVDMAANLIGRTSWAIRASASRALLPLGSRVGKVVVLAMGSVALLSLLGYPVASLIAGLGLGGLAFALAAQKTVENLFGAFSIGIDQPFREGDFVKIEDFVGTVEAIGLRSTRFRTLDRTLISIPNGKLAEMRLESYTARDRFRLATVIGLVYETTPAQMRQVLEGFERVLREHPKIWPDAIVVRFKEFAASSLDIEVMCWFQVPEWRDFQVCRQEVLLQFMDVVEAAGSSIAFPTRTVHLVSNGEEQEQAR